MLRQCKQWMRLPMFLVVGLCAACFDDHPTPLPACGAILGAPSAAGPLRILPSMIPGVTIDSARWSSYTSSPEMSTQTTVHYEAYVTSTISMPLSQLAIQFHSSDVKEDSLLLIEGGRMTKRCVAAYDCTQLGGDSIRPQQPRRALAFQIVPGQKPGPWGCPQSAQVIEWRERLRQ